MQRKKGKTEKLEKERELPADGATTCCC